VLNTRKNRFLNKEYGIVGKTVMTCNPTQNFMRFGELAALKVRRFDAERKQLNVVESVTEVGSELVWTTPRPTRRALYLSRANLPPPWKNAARASSPTI